MEKLICPHCEEEKEQLLYSCFGRISLVDENETEYIAKLFCQDQDFASYCIKILSMYSCSVCLHQSCRNLCKQRELFAENDGVFFLLPSCLTAYKKNRNEVFEYQEGVSMSHASVYTSSTSNPLTLTEYNTAKFNGEFVVRFDQQLTHFIPFKAISYPIDSENIFLPIIKLRTRSFILKEIIETKTTDKDPILLINYELLLDLFPSETCVTILLYV